MPTERSDLSQSEAHDHVTDSIQGANPFVGLTPEQVARAAGRWAGALAARPSVIASAVGSWLGQQAAVLVGASEITPDNKDRRFSDPAWQNGLWRRVLQSYLVTRQAVMGTIDRLDLDPKSADRARFALMQVTEAAAPTNNLITNPAAQRRALETRGRSLVDGGRHLLYDIRHNRGMPSQVDTRPFRLGDTMAATPGAVVYRTPLFELIQYTPVTPIVKSIPMVLIPPQINRYYVLDLAPGRSLVEHAVNSGLQVFAVSWRNPEPRHRHWALDDYAEASIDAMSVAADIAGVSSVNIAGFCSGGMTTSALLAHLAEEENPLVNAATLAVTMIDADVHSTLNMFANDKTLSAAIERSAKEGALRGDVLARMFAFVRPNDLIWNYVVSNYLLGQNPPAFDVLAWNKDTTNLPACLHADFLNIWIDNALMHPGSLKVLGTPVNLGEVRNDLYVVGATTDHLVPWHSAYAATQVFGGDVRYVLSNSGHIQALINPPGNPRASYLTGHTNPPDPQEWLRDAKKHAGSWWDDWVAWSLERSGTDRPARDEFGSNQYAVLGTAPGEYVHQ